MDDLHEVFWYFHGSAVPEYYLFIYFFHFVREKVNRMAELREQIELKELAHEGICFTTNKKFALKGDFIV